MYEQFSKYLTTDPQTRARKLAALLMYIDTEKVLGEQSYVPEEILKIEQVSMSADVPDESIPLYEWEPHKIYTYETKKYLVIVTEYGDLVRKIAPDNPKPTVYYSWDWTKKYVAQGTHLVDMTDELSFIISNYEMTHLEEWLSTATDTDVQKAILRELVQIKRQLWYANNIFRNDNTEYTD